MGNVDTLHSHNIGVTVKEGGPPMTTYLYNHKMNIAEGACGIIDWA